MSMGIKNKMQKPSAASLSLPSPWLIGRLALQPAADPLTSVMVVASVCDSVSPPLEMEKTKSVCEPSLASGETNAGVFAM